MKRNNFLILLSVFLLSLLLVLSGCNSPAVVNSDNATVNITSASSGKIDDKTALTASGVEKLISLNQETIISDDGKSATVKITAANSKDSSVVLSVKQGAGENVKRVTENQVISFGTLRICVDDVVVDEKTGSAQALIIPTFSQKAVAWFSMATLSNVNLTCNVFKSAVENSDDKNGAVVFFSEQFKTTTDADEFVKKAYSELLSKQLDSLSAQAWDFYVKENGRDKFLTLLVESEEFAIRENSIK